MKKKNNKPEQRFIPTKKIEIRTVGEEGETEQRFVDGVGIVYGQEVEIWPGYMESVRAGAFGDTLGSGEEIKSYFNHNPDFVLATTKSEPALELKDTDAGLEFSAPIPPTSYGEDLSINLERKNVRGASFSFTVEEDTLTTEKVEGGDEIYHREIVKATLYEVGPVTNPAYPQTEVGQRDLENICTEIKERVAEERNNSEEEKEETSDLEYYKHLLNLTERSI